MIDNPKLFTIIIEAGLIIGGLLLFTQGIRFIIKGRKLNGLAVFFLAFGVIIDGFTTFNQISGLNHFLPELANEIVLVIEALCFVAGSVIIVFVNSEL